MPACAYVFYTSVDSLLNKVYQKLQKQLPGVQKLALQQEQQKWCKEKNNFFATQDKQYEDSERTDIWGPEMRVVTWGEKESFIEKRLWVLVNKLEYINAPVKIKKVDSLLSTMFNNSQPGIGIGVVQNGNTVYATGFGLKNITTKEGNSSTTNFNIASLTKQFTAMAILQLAEKGKLSLDDSPGKYLSDLNKTVAAKITIRNLLTHSSGIVDHYGLIKDTTLKHAHNIDVYNAIKNIDTTYFTPGTQFRYSNTAFCMLALIIEKASGMGYNQYMLQNVFTPAGMQHTTLWNEHAALYNPATGYAYDSATHNFVKSGADEHVFFSTEGDGGVYTSIEDYIQWFEALQDGKVFSKKIVQQARSIEFSIDKQKQLGYGFGWFVDAGTGPVKVYHSGDNSGFRTFSFSIPSQNFLIVIFANREDINIEELVQKIYQILQPGVKPFVKVEELTS